MHETFEDGSTSVSKVKKIATCQVLGFDCDPKDLCTACLGSGNEPGDSCCHCDRCFDAEIGWSTGIEPGTPSVKGARELVAESRKE